MVKLRRIWKLFKWTVGILLALIVICGFILAIPAVQTRIAQEAAKYLESEYGVEVQIASAAIQLPGTAYLRGVYAPDHHNDTLIFAKEIKFEFNGFQNNHLKVGEIALAGGDLQMRKYQGDDLYNFAIWLEHFNDTTASTGNVFKMSVADINVTEFDFYKHPLGCEECTWLDFYDGEIRASDFELIGAYVSADVEQLRYKDDRRFNLLQFSGRADYQAEYMSIEDLEFHTDNSHVKGSARLNYSELNDFSDFVNAVQMKGEFVQAEVSSDEFISYIPEFPQFDKFQFQGEFQGLVNDLTTTKVDARLGSTRFYGDVYLKDCTTPDQLYIDAYVGRCSTIGLDVQRYLPQFLENELPEEVGLFTAVTFDGHFEGTLKDFSSNGSFQTNLGDLTADVTFNNLSNLEKASYEGEVDIKRFDAGTLLNNTDLGRITASGSVQGSGLTPRSASASLDLEGSAVEFRQSEINNLAVEGVVADRKFIGDFHIHDDLVNVDFDGLLDFTRDTAALSFTAIVDSTDLHSIGLINDTISWFSAEVDADFSLYKQEWWQGSIKIDDITYRRADEVFAYNEVFLNSSNAGNVTRNEIASDILDGYIEGQYQLLDVYQPLMMALASVNQHFPYEPDELIDINCDYRLVLKQTDILTSLILPGIRFAPGTKVNGSLRSENNYVDVRFSSPGMDLYGTYLDTSEFRLKGADGRYVANAKVRSVFTADNFESDNLAFRATFLKDSSLVDVRALLKDSVDSDLHFNGYVVQPERETFAVHWNEAIFNVGIDTLEIGPDNKLLIEDNRYVFDNYAFEGNNGQLYLNGTLSSEPYEILRARLVGLDLSIVNYLLREPNTYFRGQAHGMVYFNDLFNHPSVGGRLEVDSLELNDQQLGHLDLNIDWDIQNNVQRLQGGITLGTRQTFALSGRIAQDSLNPLLINLDLSRFRLSAFNPYLAGVMDNLRGTVEGKIQIAGTLAKPTLDGDLRLPNAAFSIPFLGTDYNFEGSPIVHLNSSQIVLDRVKMRDTKEQSVGYASGVINHRNLSDLNFDLEIDADRLLGMDLKAGENQYFYGKAFASGKVRIIGPTDQMNLRIDVEAQEGTAIRLPLTSATEVGRSDFITFVDPTESEDSTAFGFRRELKVDDLGGLSITVNANMRPEAEVRLVMDETVGGDMIAKGEGLIKISLSPSGDLSILGNYEVSEGRYNFNLQNVVRRPFVIQSGSTLRWNGDPFDAQIDLRAIRQDRTSLYGMVSEVNGYEGQRYRVNLIMHLTGDLMNPNIEFDIEVPNAPVAWQEEIRNRLNDQDKLTENAFSILAGYGFVDPNGSIVEDVGSQGVTQLTNLMSSWANRSLGDIGDFNVTYQSNDNLNDPEAAQGTEWEVGYSTQLLDDRLTLNTNVDIPVNSGTQQDPTGDVEVEYKITEDGRFRARAFNRSNQNNPALVQLSSYSQGVGVFYRTDFNTWNDLIEKVFGYRPEETRVDEGQEGQEELEDQDESADAR
ncbi:MAG: translocation/assembly module TamB [Flavobacteriia bacterium]|nr:translocation/assembly module TamB [Flavobacteriia bacterium]